MGKKWKQWQILFSWDPKITAGDAAALKLRHLLHDSRVLWTARRSNQSILKEINPQYSLEGLLLNLQNFGPLMRRADSLEKDLDEKGGGGRGWDD